jgi:hypothetical protein
MSTSLNIQLPFSFVAPQILATTTPEENAFILELGCKAFAQVHQQSDAKHNKDLFSRLEKAASEAYIKKERELTASLTEKDQVISGTKRKLEEEVFLRQRSEQMIRQEERRNREEICKEKDARIESLEADLKRSLRQVESAVNLSNKDLQANFNQFKEQFFKMTTTSQAKGKGAEVIFEELLKRSFGATSIGDDFSIQNFGQQEGHKGDIHMTMRGMKTMWEVKNYSRIVDSKEVQKFHQDMMTNPDISVGIMVSMCSGIQGHTKAGDIDLYPMPDGRMCIYINNFEKHEDPQYYLQSLQPFLEIFSKQHKKLIENNDKDDDNVSALELEQLKKTNTVIQLMLKEHQKKTVDLRNMFNGAKKKNEQIWTELQVKLKDTEHSTKQMLRTLLEIDDEDAAASSSKPNEDIFFKPFDYEVLSDEQRKFVDIIRRNFNFIDEAEMQAKDVRDILKGELSERLIIKMQETMVLEDAWKKGSVKVKNLCKV